MNEHTKTPLDQIPAIGISMQHQLDDFRSLVFQTHVASDCGEAEINDRLDKLRKASERQKALTQLPTKRGQLLLKQDGLKQETEKLYSLEAEQGVLHSRWAQAHDESGRRGAMKPGPQQKADMQRLEGQLATSRQAIVVLQKEIVLFERQIADMESLIGEKAEEE